MAKAAEYSKLSRAELARYINDWEFAGKQFFLERIYLLARLSVRTGHINTKPSQVRAVSAHASHTRVDTELSLFTALPSPQALAQGSRRDPSAGGQAVREDAVPRGRSYPEASSSHRVRDGR